MPLTHPAYDSDRYADVVLAHRGLVGYWRLNESSGSTARDLTGQRHGTYTVAPNYLKESPVKGGNSAGFTGTQYVTIADADALSPGTTGQMSWSLWTKPNDTVQNHLIAKGTGSNYEWGILRGVLPLFTNGTGFVAQMWQSGGTSYAVVQTGSGTAPTGQWCHLVVTLVQASALRIYMNGVQVALSTSFTGSQANGTSAVNIGRRPDNVRFYNGNIGDVAIWNRALTAGEAMTLYAEGAR